MRPKKSAVRLDPGLELLAARLVQVQSACVLATVISATGSTYRKPGARMLIEPDGRITGLLSGGCLEQDLREHATPVLETGVARTVVYDMSADNDLMFGMGAGCEGCVGILLERVTRGGPVAQAITGACDVSRTGMPTVLVTTHEGPTGLRGTRLWRNPRHELPEGMLADACVRALETASPQTCRWAEEGSPCAAWIQAILSLPAVLICGAGADAEPLAAAFRALQFPVTVTDHRPAFADPARFSGSDVSLGSASSLASRVGLPQFFAAVVMSHHLATDAAYLRELAPSGIAYLGVLGPARRRKRLMAELDDVADLLEGHLRGPIGLDVGAVTPEAIALSIAAEVHAVAAAGNAAPVSQAVKPASSPAAQQMVP